MSYWANILTGAITESDIPPYDECRSILGSFDTEKAAVKALNIFRNEEHRQELGDKSEVVYLLSGTDIPGWKITTIADLLKCKVIAIHFQI